MTDITVSFGADTKDLNAAFTAVRTQAQSFGGTIKAASDQGGDSFSKLTAAVKENTVAVQANKTSWFEIAFGVTVGEAAFAALSGAVALAGRGARATGNDFLTFGKQLEGIWGAEITGGVALARSVIDNYGSMKRSAEVFLFGEKSVAEAMVDRAAKEAAAAERAKESWGHYFTSFAIGRESVLAWEAVAKEATQREQALSTALVEGSAVAMAAAGTMGTFVESLKGSEFEQGTEGLRDLIEKLQEIPDVTAEEAVAIQNVLGSIPGYTGALGDALASVVVDIADSAEAAKTLAASLKLAFSDPAANGEQFIANLGEMSIALKEQFETAKQTFNVNEMRGALLSALNAKEQNIAAEELRRLKEKGDLETAQNRKALEDIEKMRVAGKSISFLPDIFGVGAQAEKLAQDMLAAVGPTQATADAIKSAADNLERLRTNGAEAVETLRNLPQTDEQVFFAAKPIIANARPQSDQIDDLTQKLKVLYEEKERLQAEGSPFGALDTPDITRELQRNKEATDSLEDSLRKLQDRRKGGSATQLLEVSQAQAREKFTLDESAGHLALAASLDQEASETKNLVEAKSLVKRASEERKLGLEQAAAVTEATARREAAAEEAGSDAQVAAIKRANAAKRAVTPPGAERVNLGAADDAAERSRQAVLDADARAGEDARYRIKQEGLAAEATLIRQQAYDERIGHQEERVELLANLSALEEAQREHYAKIKEIYGAGTSEFREAQKHIEQIAAESALKRVNIERQVGQQISATQKQTTEQAASTFSQAITGIITGQTHLRDATRQIGAQMLQTYIQFAIKELLVHSGIVGQTVAQVVTGEAAKTAAVTAGVTARASTESAGVVASTAGTISAVLKSITASASETFAGIFGFLSPVLGPAAAGPAAAGEATVLAVAGGLAVGAWQLPGDMLVQAHKGEMVVPAGVTPWAQGMLSGGSNASGGGTVNVHHATNFHVSAMDSRSVKQFFNDHGRTIMRSINESVRTGSHVGLSRLGRA